MEFSIRPLDEAEVPAIQALTDTEGWNHSAEYLDFARKTNPQGYLVAVDQNGKILCHCGGTFVTKEIGLIAFYITEPEMRGKGISKKVFDGCMAQLGDINIALNAVRHRTDMYAKAGFKHESFTITGFIGYPKYDILDKIPCNKEIEITAMTSQHVEKVLEYDANIHPVPRQALMKKWFDRPGMRTLVATRDGAVVGYVGIIAAVEGYRVSPFYADSPGIARTLWKAATDKVEKDSKIEVACIIEDGIKLFSETLSLATDVFYSVRMFTKEIVQPKTDVVLQCKNVHQRNSAT